MKKILFISNSLLPNDTDISKYKYCYYYKLLDTCYVCNYNDNQTIEKVVLQNRRNIHCFNKDLLEIYKESKTFEDIQTKAFLMSKQYNCDYSYNNNNDFILKSLMGECNNAPKNYNDAMFFLKYVSNNLYEKYQLHLDIHIITENKLIK